MPKKLVFSYNYYLVNPPNPRRGTSRKSYWIISFYQTNQTSRTYQTGQTPETCPLTPIPCPLTPNIRAKVIKNIFISYFLNLFYISSLVIRNSSFVTRHFLTFFLYFSLLLSFYFVVYQTATFLVIYIFTIQCFSISLTFYLCGRIRY